MFHITSKGDLPCIIFIPSKSHNQMAAYNRLVFKVLVFLIPIFGAGFNVSAQEAQKANLGLKDYYQEFFSIGVAVTPRQLEDSAQRQLILKHFNSVTAENAMKMGPIHPEENKYQWKDADAIVDFATKNGLKIRGHTLCWYNQTPKWIFYDKRGKLVSKTILLGRLKDHIYEVVKRYKGKIYAWDVINEAVSDDPKEFLRNSLWYQICGEEFIAKAFEFAHEADPKAMLFYNDYNTELPGKREKIIRLIKSLLSAKVPIHAIGLQGHWSISGPTASVLKESILQYAMLGIKVQVTEMDISVYPDNSPGKPLEQGQQTGLSQSLENEQISKYDEFFSVFRQSKAQITGVTFWNLSDRYSWLDNFPIRGRKNYPLLFDENLQPKKAYWKVVTF